MLQQTGRILLLSPSYSFSRGGPNTAVKCSPKLSPVLHTKCACGKSAFIPDPFLCSNTEKQKVRARLISYL